MKLFRHLVVLALVTVSTTAAESRGQETLRWKFSRGDTLNYTVQQKMDTSVKIGGMDVASSMNQKMGMVWTVLEVGASDDIVMTQVIDRIQMRMENAQTGAIDFDTQNATPPDNPLARAMGDTFSNIVGKEFTVSMKPTGKVDNVTIPKALLDAIRSNAAGLPGTLDEESLKQLMRQTAITLPDQAVSPGDSWTTSQKMEFPFGTMQLSPTMTYRGRESGTNLGIIDFVPSVTLQPKKNAQVSVALKSSEGVGRVKFDIDNGRVQSMQMQMTMGMVSEAQGQKFEQTVKQTTSMTLAK